MNLPMVDYDGNEINIMEVISDIITEMQGGKMMPKYMLGYGVIPLTDKLFADIYFDNGTEIDDDIIVGGIKIDLKQRRNDVREETFRSIYGTAWLMESIFVPRSVLLEQNDENSVLQIIVEDIKQLIDAYNAQYE